jgi:hypothetical protein
MGFFNPEGRYIRDDAAVALKLPIGFATADAAPLFRLPSDATQRLLLESLFWEVTAAFTGGSSSAIGVSSSQSPYNTKGDLLGGGSGDVLATLTTGIKGGTIGADFGSNGIIVLNPGAIIRFDRITSAFTAGAGFVHVLGRQIPL